MAHALELAACPPDDIGVDPLESGTQLRLVEMAVVGDPAANARIVHLGQIGQRLVAAFVKRPTSDVSADARQCLRTGGRLEAVREDARLTFPPHRLPGSKLEPEKVERDDRKVPAPVHILAVDDLRLHRMQHQLAGREAIAKRTPKCPRLLGAAAVTDGIVRITLERNVRKLPPHPHISISAKTGSPEAER